MDGIACAPHLMAKLGFMFEAIQKRSDTFSNSFPTVLKISYASNCDIRNDEMTSNHKNKN
jgi:hypothetical protein